MGAGRCRGGKVDVIDYSITLFSLPPLLPLPFLPPIFSTPLLTPRLTPLLPTSEPGYSGRF
ncbi:unnamed protein product, partial [Closterium sp. Naga37s-1]